MDEIVLRSMLKWPDVPSVYGWLTLDRRGHWLIKTGTGGFERVHNQTLTGFMGRNYACDEAGRYYFQNGPQRVYVALEYTPWVLRLDDRGEALLTHAGAAAGRLQAGFVDESGAILFQGGFGIGVLLDRDLAPVLERMRSDGAPVDDAFADAITRGEARECDFLGQPLRVAPIHAAEVPVRFGFVPRPVPPEGQAEC